MQMAMGSNQRIEGNVLILFFSFALAVAAGVVGGFYVKHYFDCREYKYTRSKAIIFIAVMAIVFALIAIMPLFNCVNDRTDFELLRAEVALLGLFFAGLIDLKYQVIPNKLLLVLLAISIVLLVAEAISSPAAFGLTAFGALLGAVVCGGMFLVTNLLSRNSLGMGDVKLVLVLGITLGLDDTLGGLLWSLLFALIAGVVLMATKKAKLKTKMPMAPFFFLGFWTSNIIYVATGLVGG